MKKIKLINNKERATFTLLLSLSLLMELVGITVCGWNFLFIAGIARDPATNLQYTLIWIGLGFIFAGIFLGIFLLNKIEPSISALELLAEARTAKNKERLEREKAQIEHAKWEYSEERRSFKKWKISQKLGYVSLVVTAALVMAFGIATLFGYPETSQHYKELLARRNMNPIVEQLLWGSLCIVASVGIFCISAILKTNATYIYQKKLKEDEEWDDIIYDLSDKSR